MNYLHIPLGCLVMIVLSALPLTPASAGETLSREEQMQAAKEFLEGKSPEEVAWYKSVNWRLRMRDYMAYVKDDPDLPRVLLIGDSISMNYTIPVRELLEGKANLHRIPANGGDTARGLDHLDTWLGDGNWDVIHFNFGIHDLKHLRDGKWDITGEPIGNPETYERNLRELVQRLQATGATLIWASTTPIPEGAPGVPAGGEIELNAIAERVMNEHGIGINDLHAHMTEKLHVYQRPRDVHYGEEGSKYLAEAVAAHILEALKSNQLDKPSAKQSRTDEEHN